MENNWAAENLQTIRTLMERSAIYRRALAPVMIFVGTMGTAAAFAGALLKMDSPFRFIGFWICVAAVTAVGAFLLVRRQALTDGEPFWSPPTRRILQAVLPAFTAGLLSSVVFLVLAAGPSGSEPPDNGSSADIAVLTVGWIFLYGCAIHAAGFFVPRGLRWFGWLLIIGANLALAILLFREGPVPTGVGHWLMGAFFGLSHLAYGIYLYFTEPRNNEA